MTVTEPPVPQEAVNAAAKAMHYDVFHAEHGGYSACGCGNPVEHDLNLRADMGSARRAAEAAAPAIRAAERERIRQLAIDRNALYLAAATDAEPSGMLPFADLIGR